MTPPTYRRLPWPNDRPGTSITEAGWRLGVRGRRVLDLVDEGRIAIWIHPGVEVCVDAEEVEAIAREWEANGGDPKAAGEA